MTHSPSLSLCPWKKGSSTLNCTPVSTIIFMKVWDFTALSNCRVFMNKDAHSENLMSCLCVWKKHCSLFSWNRSSSIRSFSSSLLRTYATSPCSSLSFLFAPLYAFSCFWNRSLSFILQFYIRLFILLIITSMLFIYFYLPYSKFYRKLRKNNQPTLFLN